MLGAVPIRRRVLSGDHHARLPSNMNGSRPRSPARIRANVVVSPDTRSRIT